MGRKPPRPMRGYFPGLGEAEYEARLACRVENGEARAFRHGEQIPAAILFSKERRALDFLAVSPGYRRRGLARKRTETAAAQFPVGTTLSVATYRPRTRWARPPVGFTRESGLRSERRSPCSAIPANGFLSPCRTARWGINEEK